MSIRVTLNCPVNTDKLEPLVQFLAANLENVRNFKGCHSVDVYFTDDKNTLLLDEQWQDIEHHQSYIQFIQSNGVMAALVDYFQAPPIVTYLTKMAI